MNNVKGLEKLIGVAWSALLGQGLSAFFKMAFFHLTIFSHFDSLGPFTFGKRHKTGGEILRSGNIIFETLKNMEIR